MRSATSVRPTSSCTHDETGEFEVRVKARGQIARYIYRASSARRRRMGWPSVAVRLQHSRLRADHRPRASAAARASDVRRPGLRGVLVRAAAVRLPSAFHPGAVQPFERRFRRGHLLRGRRFHVAPRRRARPRSPCIPTAFRTVRIPGTYEGSIGKTRTERARRHGRYVPSAEADDRRPWRSKTSTTRSAG